MTLPVLSAHLPASNESFAPWVEVLVSTVTEAGAATANVLRTAQGRTMLVRGGVKRSVSGGFSVPDSEVPFGVQVDYKLEIFNSAGLSVGFSDSASIVLDVTDTWVHQPLAPSLATRVQYRSSATKSLSRPSPGEVVYSGGSALGKWIGDTRRGLQNVALDVVTDTLAQADMLQSIWGTYDNPQLPIVCFRTPPPVRLPRVLFAAVPEPVEMEQDVSLGGELIFWDLSGTEVEPPFPGLVEPLLTYDDLDAFYSTYSAMDSAYSGYLQRDRDYSLSGYAS